MNKQAKEAQINQFMLLLSLFLWPCIVALCLCLLFGVLCNLSSKNIKTNMDTTKNVIATHPAPKDIKYQSHVSIYLLFCYCHCCCACVYLLMAIFPIQLDRIFDSDTYQLVFGNCHHLYSARNTIHLLWIDWSDQERGRESLIEKNVHG